MRLVQCLNGIHFSGGGVGRGNPNLPLLVPYIPSSCPFILGFLPVALGYRLQNTKDCCVIYRPPALSSPASGIAPALILPLSRLPVLPHFPER